MQTMVFILSTLFSGYLSERLHQKNASVRTAFILFFMLMASSLVMLDVFVYHNRTVHAFAVSLCFAIAASAIAAIAYYYSLKRRNRKNT
ncbi:MAG: hypothetical protein V4490_02765 [Pseudomonadota bacterium]